MMSWLIRAVRAGCCLATDRSGVLASDDGAQTFTASNHGYTHRYVTSILADKNDPSTIYVGVVNDREWGGVFYSHDGGQHWLQKSSGLGGRDVFSLKQASSGSMVAGTNRGIFMLEQNASEWRPINTVLNEKISYRTVKKGKKTTKVAVRSATRSVLEARVNDVEIAPNKWMAATTSGLFTSTDQGKSWTGGPVLGKQEFVSASMKGEQMVVATRTEVLHSNDGGATWNASKPASFISSIRGVALTPDGEILVASREGAYRSESGDTWEHLLNGIPDKNISSITYEETTGKLLATSTATSVVFQSQDNGRSWHRGPDTGYPLRHVSMVAGRFMGATPFDGVIVQPDNDKQSAEAETTGGSSN